MRNFWLNIPRSVSAVRALELSKEAKHRLRMMQWYDKRVVLLRDQGWQCSTSMVGRILKRLKESGRLVEAPGADPWHPRRPFLRPYGVRKPKEYLADRPGAIVQVDTAHVSL